VRRFRKAGGEPPERKAYDVGLDLLSRREHAGSELRGKLRQRGYTNIDIEEALSKLKEGGYLNDDRAASARARTLFRKGYGESYVRSDLAHKGLKPGTEVLSDARSDSGTTANTVLESLIEKKLRGIDAKALSRDERYKLERKILSSVMRKGFSLSEAKSIFARLTQPET